MELKPSLNNFWTGWSIENSPGRFICLYSFINITAKSGAALVLILQLERDILTYIIWKDRNNLYMSLFNLMYASPNTEISNILLDLLFTVLRAKKNSKLVNVSEQYYFIFSTIIVIDISLFLLFSCLERVEIIEYFIKISVQE